MDDEKIYNAILDELRESGPRQGLWAKCFTEANGNENAAKALYFKYRAQQLANQEKPATSNSSSTDLSKNITSNTKTVPSRNGIKVAFLLLGIVAIFLAIMVSQQIEKKKKEDARRAEVVAAQIAEVTALLNVKPKTEVEKETPKFEITESNQTSDPAAAIKKKEYDQLGQTMHDSMRLKLELFKYKIKLNGETLYSRDEEYFYHLESIWVTFRANDVASEVVEKIIGEPNKGEPNIVIYKIQEYTNVAKSIHYCYRSREFDTSKFINCFQSLESLQFPNIKINKNSIELTYAGYTKDDSTRSTLIPISKRYEYINGDLVCTSGQCDFKNFEK